MSKYNDRGAYETLQRDCSNRSVLYQRGILIPTELSEGEDYILKVIFNV